MTQIDYQKAEEAARKFNSEVQQIADAFMSSFDKVFDEWRPSLEKVADAMQPLYDFYYQSYLRAGAPYGETHEGMLQWMDRDKVENGG